MFTLMIRLLLLLLAVQTVNATYAFSTLSKTIGSKELVIKLTSNAYDPPVLQSWPDKFTCTTRTESITGLTKTREYRCHVEGAVNLDRCPNVIPGSITKPIFILAADEGALSTTQINKYRISCDSSIEYDFEGSVSIIARMVPRGFLKKYILSGTAAIIGFLALFPLLKHNDNSNLAKVINKVAKNVAVTFVKFLKERTKDIESTTTTTTTKRRKSISRREKERNDNFKSDIIDY